jgi:hypothetical protein
MTGTSDAASVRAEQAPKARLNPGTLALVHHAALTEAGWWDRTLREILLAALYQKNAMSVAQLVDAIQSMGFTVSPALVAAQATVLVHEGDALEIEAGTYKASEACKARLTSGANHVLEIENACRDRFVTCLRDQDVEGGEEELWERCVAEFIEPLVHDLGARTIELLSLEKQNFINDDKVQRVAEKIADRLGEPVRRALIAFLDPSDSAVRAFVLRR